MTRQQALAQVADWIAGNLEGATFEEATGIHDLDKLSDADADRLAWAVEEVGRRLRHMGGTR
jgi:hypothetical protein